MSVVKILILTLFLGVGCKEKEKKDPKAKKAKTTVVAPDSKRTPNPGFDCAKAKSWASRTICSDADVADLDREMNRVYNERRQNMDAEEKKKFRDWQRAWRKNQRDNCELLSERELQLECLKQAQAIQIEAIKRY